MDRRNFLKKTLYSASILGSAPVISSCYSLKNSPTYLRPALMAPDAEVSTNFNRALSWMKDNNWNDYIQAELGLTPPSELSLENMMSATLPVDHTLKGLDDFGGSKWIEPGVPSRSLLYHLLASPRIQCDSIGGYPEVAILDAVENLIFDVADWNEPDIKNRDTHLMVLAYEYRPAFKTPISDAHHKMAQLVFSKSGVARIGNQPANYDAPNRCFTNKPLDPGKSNDIAVAPARYALFEVELVKADSEQIQLMNRDTKEYIGNWLFHEHRYFIRPIRKIYNTSARKVSFSQYHRNEKLAALSDYSYDGDAIELRPSNLDFHRPPFVRVSATQSDGSTYSYHNTDLKMVSLEMTGSSSVLLVPDATDMVREARQNGERILVKVPKAFERANHHTNRRYAAMKLPNEHGSEVRSVIASDVLGRLVEKRRFGLHSPKNAPQFLNIKFAYNEKTGDLDHIDGQMDCSNNNAFEKKIHEGGYFAQVFEDSICDGCVAAEVINMPKDGAKPSRDCNALPALSFVTAPDFFPLVDSNDIRSVFTKDHHFYEGGTLNLSTVRMRGNPNIINPCTQTQAFASTYLDDKSFDTNLATVSVNQSQLAYESGFPLRKAVQSRLGTEADARFRSKQDRDFHTTSYLPDTGTGVFYPAWDITYSNPQTDSSNHFLATIGLGSPFPEDMKLCAAANGMWPVTSPDAGRTFQGSLDYLFGKRPNTSIPLMDEEIGYHMLSPYVSAFGGEETHGWDGEQGPFVQADGTNIFINYTDIARADYMLNLIDGPGFDMSQLRELKVCEIIDRMTCLENSIAAIESDKVWKSDLWLVSASKVDNWRAGAVDKPLPDDGPYPFDDCYQPQDDKLTGKGYLYVFAKVPKNHNNEDAKFDDRDDLRKRRKLKCEKLWICQSTPEFTAFKEVDLSEPGSAEWVRERARA